MILESTEIVEVDNIQQLMELDVQIRNVTTKEVKRYA
jgi:hypothetical protein